MKDPRHQNEVFDHSSLEKYLGDYADRLRSALVSVDPRSLELAHELIVGASRTGNRVHAIGNGGSAAIAEHLACDFTKGTHVSGHPVIETHSLTSNVALYSAIANDYGFEQVFATQVAFVGKPGDVLIAVSSSGNSPNILRGVDMAHELGISTIGLSGFAGGTLRTSANVSLHVACNNYGIVEDAHQSLMHVLAQYIACHRDARVP